MQSLILTIALVGALVAFHWLKNAPDRIRKKAVRTGLIYGGIAVLAILVLTGRINPLIAALGALIPLAQRAFSTWQLFRKVAGTTDDAQSTVRSHHLHMAVNHANGRLTGKVLVGPNSGRSLDELDTSELLELFDFYARSDRQAGLLLQAYLDQRVSGWREKYGKAGIPPGNRPEREENMTLQEASEILGVPVDATRDAVVNAHKRLIQKLHPDRGGSTYLASKVNLAKARMLDSA